MSTAYDWPIGPTAEEKRKADEAAAATKKTAEEKAANLNATDPDVIGKSIESVIGSRKFGEQMRNLVADVFKEYSIGPAERRGLVFPEAGGGQGEYKYRMLDLTDRKGWKQEHIREARIELLGGFLRSVLCVKGFAFRGLVEQKAILEKNVGSPLSDDVLRALTTEDDEGGALMPVGHIPELIKDVPRLTQLYDKVRKIPVGQDSGKFPITAANARVFWGEEGAALARSEPGFGKVQWQVNRCGAFAEFTRELMDGSNPDVVAAVSEMFTEALAAENDRMIAVGPGSDRPLGLYYATGVIDVTFDEMDMNYDTLMKLKHSINIRYHKRSGFMWVMSQTTYMACLLIKDENGLPILNDAKGSEPAKLLDVPFAVINDLPPGFVGIGDFGYYLWFDRRTLVIERSNEAGDLFYKHESAIKIVQHVDGKLAIPPTKPWARVRNFDTYDGGETFPVLENDDG